MKVALFNKILLPIILLLILPVSCFAQGAEKALGAAIEIFIYLLYFGTVLSILLYYKFYVTRINLTKQLSLIMSFCLSLAGLFIVLTSGPMPDEIPDENDIEFTRKQLLIGYTILIPNLVIALVGPFIKSYRQFEAILGRSEDDNNIIIWVRLNRNTNGKFEITYFNSLDKDRNGFRNFYTLVNLGSQENAEKKQFASFQDAVDYIRTTYNLPEVKFVEMGSLNSQYLKMLKAEEDNRK